MRAMPAKFAVVAALCSLLWAAEAKDGPSALDFAKQLNEAFVAVAEKISPSVVVIRVVHPETPEDQDSLDDLPPELRKRLGPPSQKESRRRDRPPRMVVAGGSGIIVKEDGYILTNNHVVEGAKELSVQLKDGRRFNAHICGLDPESDLAVIRVDAKGLRAARLGNSGASRVGEFVLAVGAPFELDYSVTVGHISAKGRSFETSVSVYQDQDFIQTDASINPGNSGGPLVNLDGEVIGINAMIEGLRTGIGFAVPSDIAKRVMEQLIRRGKMTRSWLGVGIRSLAEDSDFRGLSPGVEDGVLIRNIVPRGPAAKSDLRPADVVVAVDGKPVRTTRQLKDDVAYKEVGQEVLLDVMRDGRAIKVKVKTEAVPEPRSRVAARAKPGGAERRGAGLKVDNLTKEWAAEFKIEQRPGVIVTDVEQDSPADYAEIEPGDVIVEAGRKPVKTAKEFRDALKASDPKKGLMITLVGADGSRRLTILKESGD
jgi:serine protease Do